MTFTLTIAAGRVASDLTNFPVMVRLSDMPALFWSTVASDGSDIVVKSGATRLPVDLARFDYVAHAGYLFFLAPSLLTASDNTFTIQCGVAVTPFTPTVSALTVTNPGAESGTTGWTNDLGTLGTRAASPSPHSGSAYFFGGANAETRAHQDIAIPVGHQSAVDTGDRLVKVQWYQNGFGSADPDSAEMEVECRDGGGAVIITRVGSGLENVPDQATWRLRTLLLRVAPLTRTLRVSMHMLRGATGTNLDGYVDDITVSLQDVDPYGAEKVWSDYHRVFLLGVNDGFRDHSRFGTPWTPTNNTSNGNASGFVQASISPDTLSHQGVAFDGTYYYTFDTNAIRKYDGSWTLIASNTNPAGDVNTLTGDGTMNHLGDGEVKGGFLYTEVSNFPGGGSGHAYLAKFDAATLALVSAPDVTGFNIASLCWVPETSEFVSVPYTGGAVSLDVFDASFTHLRTIPLSRDITWANGITWWRNRFWITGADTDLDSAFKYVTPVEYDGTVGARALQYSRTGFAEGLSHTDSALLFMASTGAGQGVVYSLTPVDLVAGGGLRVKNNPLWNPSTTNGGGKAIALTRYTTWTIGLTVSLGAKPAAVQNIASYTIDASTDDTKRATLLWSNSAPTDRLAIWNNADGFLSGGAAPSTGVAVRMHDVHESTTQRKYYENGALQGTDATITAMPAATASALYLGFDDASAAGPLTGDIGFVYLRPSALSADWIAAEQSNLSAPATFYGVVATFTVDNYTRILRGVCRGIGRGVR